MANEALVHHADLSAFSSFGLPAQAEYLCIISNRDDLKDLTHTPSPHLVLGQGTNTVFLSDWPGTVWVNRLMGIRSEIIDDQVRVQVAGGESWHDLVCHCLDRGWHGLENLALIPGTVGAAPIQNIGAYGVELSEFVESVLAWDVNHQCFKTFSQDACEFGYRDSVFKHLPQAQLIIVEVTLRLDLHYQPKLGYPTLQAALGHAVAKSPPSPKRLVETIIKLRQERLPDPKHTGNVGSFFKNPVVSSQTWTQLEIDYPDMPHWPVRQGNAEAYKLSAAWMIEALGLKGYGVGQAQVSPDHALVLINRGGASASDVGQLVRHIQSEVHASFGIELVPEPLLIQH